MLATTTTIMTPKCQRPGKRPEKKNVPHRTRTFRPGRTLFLVSWIAILPIVENVNALVGAAVTAVLAGVVRGAGVVGESPPEAFLAGCHKRLKIPGFPSSGFLDMSVSPRYNA